MTNRNILELQRIYIINLVSLRILYENGLAGFKYNSSTYFYRKDITGNVIAILDNGGSDLYYRFFDYSEQIKDEYF